MTKKLSVIFAIIMTAVTVWALASCGADPMQNVSERRCAYYTAEDDVFTVTAVSGVREEPFTLDGRAGELVAYTLVTVVPRSFDVDAVYTYTARTADRTFGGALIVHPFAASYSAEYPLETTGELTVTVNDGKTCREYKPASLVTSDMLDYAQAIEAAETELKPTGAYEVRVRLIKDPQGGGGLCWHVSLHYETGEEQGILLDARTAKALAVKR